MTSDPETGYVHGVHPCPDMSYWQVAGIGDHEVFRQWPAIRENARILLDNMPEVATLTIRTKSGHVLFIRRDRPSWVYDSLDDAVKRIFAADPDLDSITFHKKGKDFVATPGAPYCNEWGVDRAKLDKTFW